ncbi:scavenger receptor cysteine-rich type 1 protein M130-like [Mercenaria mercenaria]|uniref:scavenger receptor cysteine-rich type 1 protein M130-like n=1 Tax=Mercenaria mercenaria TaxID=6596 RepID=UPI00234EF908|nr:scavenger receptor cysteine-rich type 1 protein M130-like [Mercenaria mercenaria]
MTCKKLISMHMVCVALLFHVLIGISTASDYLDISGIRLANGTGPFGGRVEVSINGVWGTVCDDSFDMNDAKVMCRTMNLQATAYFSGAFYGQGIGPIFAQEFKCSGYEQHIKYCKFDVNVQCTHARDISIVCTECGEVDISNGYAKSISENGRVLTVACKTGFRSNIDTSVCEAGAWSVPSIYCAAADITDIRLANGIGLYDGRVELLMNGTWGTICSTSFSWDETRAICYILYGTTSYEAYFTSSYSYGEGTGPVHIDNLDCKGTVTDINECAYSLDVSCADHSRDVAVVCRVFPLNITHTRLVNGTGPYDGRIELYVDGHWGTIDRRYVDLYDARTICNTHGARQIHREY